MLPLAGIFGLSGRALGTLFLGVVMAIIVERFIRRVQRMHKVRAKVVRGSAGQFPEFEVLSGPFKGHIGTSNMSFGFALLQIGDEVDAYYDPRKSKIVSRKGLMWMVVFFIGFVLFLVFMAALIVFFQWVWAP